MTNTLPILTIVSPTPNTLMAENRSHSSDSDPTHPNRYYGPTSFDKSSQHNGPQYNRFSRIFTLFFVNRGVRLDQECQPWTWKQKFAVWGGSLALVLVVASVLIYEGVKGNLSPSTSSVLPSSPLFPSPRHPHSCPYLLSV